PVVATMAEQEAVVSGGGDLGGTMRLGTYRHTLADGSLVARTYGTREVSERHRHRYEVNSAYGERLQQAGLRISGTSVLEDGRSLVEAVAPHPQRHPFYVGTQAHPELRSRPTRAYSLFAGLVGAAVELQKATRLLEVPPPEPDEAPHRMPPRTTTEKTPQERAEERRVGKECRRRGSKN